MPFNRATRQNFLAAPAIAHAAGQTGFSILPKVGLLKRIICLFSGTITIATAVATLGPEGPWSIISRLRLTANGNTALFDASGYGAMITSLFSAHGFSGYGGRPIIPDSATVPGPTATAFSAANFAAGGAVGANTWAFAIEIPLALADDWRDPVGLILAAAPDTVLQVEVTWAASTLTTTAQRSSPLVSATGTATVAATLTPFVEFFTIPASPADYPDLRRIHTWSEQGPQAIVANGDQDVVLQRGNSLQRIAHLVWTNSAADGTNVSGRELRFNSNEIPYKVSRQLDAVLQRKRYVRDLPDGVYAWDLWNTGTPRDAINTLNLNEITSRLTVAGATIAGTSDIRTLTEQLIQLTGATAGSA
jgi:hypothetical protein